MSDLNHLSDPTGLVGLHFHCFGPDGVLDRQGVITHYFSGMLRVQYYDWISGQLVQQATFVDPATVRGWVFYTSDAAMRRAAAYHLAAFATVEGEPDDLEEWARKTIPNV
jgi:hypothetical protein